MVPRLETANILQETCHRGHQILSQRASRNSERDGDIGEGLGGGNEEAPGRDRRKDLPGQEQRNHGKHLWIQCLNLF